MSYGFLSLFSGMGGGSLGAQRAGWDCVGAVDADPAACRTYEYLTGHPATEGDLGAMSPDDLRNVCSRRPHLVLSSPPCKGNSGCLPAARAKEDKYQAMNELAFRGIWLALEAWNAHPDGPPPLILVENVPRITVRSRRWLDQLKALLSSYGYACRETTHDCGELGGLAQHRRRFLLIARHMKQVPDFVYVPPVQRVRGVGEVFRELPVPLPHSKVGGPMHRLSKSSPLNALRLACIPAGGDWRDLPESVALRPRSARQNGGFGVNDWNAGSHAVVAEGSVRNTWASIADPRVGDGDPGSNRHQGKYGVEDWDDPAHTVIAEARTGKSWAAVNDPRLTCSPRAGAYGVTGDGAAAATVVAHGCPDNSRVVYADPRVDCVRRDGGHGVKGWRQPSAPVIAAATMHNHPSQVADPRLAHAPRGGSYGVLGWKTPSYTVRGVQKPQNGADTVADPRFAVPSHYLAMEGDQLVCVGAPLDLETTRATYTIIQALDGTWHRPMTTLELAVLQGFPARHRGDWLKLDGNSHQVWRGLIGNAIPVQTAEAICRVMAESLDAARDGGLLLSAQPVWVEPPRPAL